MEMTIGWWTFVVSLKVPIPVIAENCMPYFWMIEKTTWQASFNKISRHRLYYVTSRLIWIYKIYHLPCHRCQPQYMKPLPLLFGIMKETEMNLHAINVSHVLTHIYCRAHFHITTYRHFSFRLFISHRILFCRFFFALFFVTKNIFCSFGQYYVQYVILCSIPLHRRKKNARNEEK